MPDSLQQRYGQWALVTGSASGIGAAICRALAEQGMDLLMVDRQQGPNQALADELATEHAVQTTSITLDLTDSGLVEHAQRWARDYDIGVAVCNAGISPMGDFLSVPLADHQATLDLNCGAALTLTHTLGRAMLDRGKGAVVLLSSGAALTGAPLVAHYAATKSYAMTLAIGLWAELHQAGVDVLAVCPGVTRTPAIESRHPDFGAVPMVRVHEPSDVAQAIVDNLSRGPVIVPTLSDRIGNWILTRLMGRRRAVKTVGSSIARLYPRAPRAVDKGEGWR